MDAPAKTQAGSSTGTFPPDEEFVSRQKLRLECDEEMLLRELSSVERDERRWIEDSRESRHDAMDLGSSLIVREVDAYLERKLGERLVRARRALEKIEEGTYGLCDTTGEVIPEGRLRAVPEAIHAAHQQPTIARKPLAARRGSHGWRKR